MAKFQQYPGVHDPESVMDYGRNWGDAADGTKGWLLENEIIVHSIWEIASDREAIPTLIISQQGAGINSLGKITSVFLEGGTAGVVYKVTNEITTSNPDNTVRIERKTGLLTCCES